MRINKRLAELGLCSRREADRLLAAGRVRVNGEMACLGQQVSETDRLEIDSELLSGERARPVLLAYHKPRGIVCTSSDKDRAQNIIDALNYPERVYPIGRLDKESEGLILLTNRGELVNRINRAEHGHEKEYVVTVNRLLTPEFLSRMAAGVYLEELGLTTAPCRVWQSREGSQNRRLHEFHIVLTQGMNRQIRRMCRALGYEVRRLQRVRIMQLTLGKLAPGDYREISVEELGLKEDDSDAI